MCIINLFIYRLYSSATLEERKEFITQKYTERKFTDKTLEPISITELYDYIHNPECDPVELYCKLFTVYDKAKNSYDELIEKDGYKGTLMHLCIKEKNIPLIEWLIWNNLCLEYKYI